MPTDTRGQRKAFVRSLGQQRRKSYDAAWRKHPVLLTSTVTVAFFVLYAIRLSGRHSGVHGGWIFLWAGAGALPLLGLALWRVRRARRTDDQNG